MDLAAAVAAAVDSFNGPLDKLRPPIRFVPVLFG